VDLTVNGFRCHLTSSGPPRSVAGRPCSPVVLVHGAANDHDAWLGVADLLAAAGQHVLVPDLPGHGLSAGAPLRSIEALADWLAELLDAASVTQAVLVGHSMGSLVALECAARHRQRVSRLALLGTSVPMPVADALLGQATSAPDQVCRMMSAYSASSRFLRTGGQRGHGIWGPGLMLAIMRRSPPGVLAVDLANCNDYQNGLRAAAQVHCPTLLVVARRDRMTPRRNLPPLLAALPACERSELADCGHAMMSEQPGALANALLAFVTAGQPTAFARQ